MKGEGYFGKVIILFVKEVRLLGLRKLSVSIDVVIEGFYLFNK